MNSCKDVALFGGHLLISVMRRPVTRSVTRSLSAVCYTFVGIHKGFQEKICPDN